MSKWAAHIEKQAIISSRILLCRIQKQDQSVYVAAFYYQFATSVGYFRGRRRNKKIDVVVDYPNIKNILIEVKYRDGAPVADDDAIIEYCESASAGIVVTKDAGDFGVHNIKSGHALLRIPAFAFLYLLGNAEKNGYRGIE